MSPKKQQPRARYLNYLNKLLLHELCSQIPLNLLLPHPRRLSRVHPGLKCSPHRLLLPYTLLEYLSSFSRSLPCLLKTLQSVLRSLLPRTTSSSSPEFCGPSPLNRLSSQPLRRRKKKKNGIYNGPPGSPSSVTHTSRRGFLPSPLFPQ
jgi:hypothetical protein